MTIAYILGIGFPLLLIAISGHIIWRSTDSFEAAADYLGRKMSHGVKGASINAVASSMPEFLTTMFFLFYIKDNGEFIDSFSGGLGVVAGSAVFNILIIPLAVILFGSAKLATSSFKLDKKVLKRDGIFLIVSNIIFIVIISQIEIKPRHGLILIGIYLIYLILLRKGFGVGVKLENEDNSAIDAVKLSLPHFLKLNLKQILLNGKQLNRKNAWSTLIISIIFMSLGTWLLVKGTELLGSPSYKLFGNELPGLDLPLVFLSVLLAAAATSIPDTMISVRDARKGNHDDSISNALGSNIFDLSFALGLPILLYTLIHGNIIMSDNIRVLSVSYWLIMWIITIIVIPIFIYSKKISKRTGLILLVLYAMFIFYIFEETLNFDWFRGIVEWLIEKVNLFQ